MSREHWHRYRGVKIGMTPKLAAEIILERFAIDPARPLGQEVHPGVYEYQGVLYSTAEQPWKILR